MSERLAAQLRGARFVPALHTDEPHAANDLFLLFQEGRLLVVREDPEAPDCTIPDRAAIAEMGVEPLRRQYLGCFTAGPDYRLHCYSGELAADLPLPNGAVAIGLREGFSLLNDPLIGLAGRAVQIVAWDRDHQFCGRCAHATKLATGDRARRCPNCGLTSFPRLSPAIIIAVTRTTAGGDEILLARNHRFPAGRYSVLAGFVEPGETLEECARREVFEEVGVQIDEIRYFASQPWPFPNSLMIGFTARYVSGQLRLEEEEIAEARWFPAHALPQIPPKISIARRLIDWFAEQNGVPLASLPEW